MNQAQKSIIARFQSRGVSFLLIIRLMAKSHILVAVIREIQKFSSLGIYQFFILIFELERLEQANAN